jgi:predicted DNA-binding protein
MSRGFLKMAKKDFQVQLATRVSITCWQALDEYSKESGKSKASIVEKAINLYLELIAEGRIDD